MCALTCESFDLEFDLLQKKNQFFSDWEKGTSGVRKGGNDDIKNDFAIKILCFVEAGQSTGYLASVKREHDAKIRYVTLCRVPIPMALLTSASYL